MESAHGGKEGYLKKRNDSLDGRASEIMLRGCNGFIQKPFNMKDLSQTIKAILSSG